MVGNPALVGAYSYEPEARGLPAVAGWSLPRQGSSGGAPLYFLCRLKRAFKGAYGAYCVTFFWAHFSPEKELAEATAMATAAKHAGVEHVIWSTLEDTRKWVPLSDSRMPTLMGQYKVPHFDAKGEANKVFTARHSFETRDREIHSGGGLTERSLLLRL